MNILFFFVYYCTFCVIMYYIYEINQTFATKIDEVTMDRRIQKTQTAIINATLELIGTCPINKLTIKEICSKANISRSTFYLHYYDAVDVLEELYNSIILKFGRIVDKYNFIDILHNPMPFLQDIFAYIRTNYHVFSMLLANDYDSNLTSRIKLLLSKNIMESNHSHFADRKKVEYGVNFIISPLVETICDNLQDIVSDQQPTLMNTLASLIKNTIEQ